MNYKEYQKIPHKPQSKFHNQKTMLDGIPFDSKKEARRYSELKLLERAGTISNLDRQVKFSLIPAQREPSTVGGRGAVHLGKVIEQECYYVADFVYLDETGEKVVEDAKGMRTKEYRIKKKLMLWIHGIRIKEV